MKKIFQNLVIHDITMTFIKYPRPNQDPNLTDVYNEISDERVIICLQKGNDRMFRSIPLNGWRSLFYKRRIRKMLVDFIAEYIALKRV